MLQLASKRAGASGSSWVFVESLLLLLLFEKQSMACDLIPKFWPSSRLPFRKHALWRRSGAMFHFHD